MPEISFAACVQAPENTIANEVNKQSTPVKNVSIKATKPWEIGSFVWAVA